MLVTERMALAPDGLDYRHLTSAMDTACRTAQKMLPASLGGILTARNRCRLFVVSRWIRLYLRVHCHYRNRLYVTWAGHEMNAARVDMLGLNMRKRMQPGSNMLGLNMRKRHRKQTRRSWSRSTSAIMYGVRNLRETCGEFEERSKNDCQCPF